VFLLPIFQIQVLVGQVLLVRAEQVAEAPQLLTKMEQELQEQLILAAAAVVVVLYQVLLPVMVMVVLVVQESLLLKKQQLQDPHQVFGT
jgi:hypothetical protein